MGNCLYCLDPQGALQTAVTTGDANAVLHLLRTGKINVNAPDQYGSTALHNAATLKHADCLSVIVDFGADVTAVDAGIFLLSFCLHVICTFMFLNIFIRWFYADPSRS